MNLSKELNNPKLCNGCSFLDKRLTFKYNDYDGNLESHCHFNYFKPVLIHTVGINVYNRPQKCIDKHG
jgi:hypothetical protein